MQFVIVTGSHGRVLAELDSEGRPLKGSLRICNEEQIKNMSAGSLRLYRNKIQAWIELVHEHGTPEAIRTIDFLRAATTRATRERTLPVC
jgi:hypothetical protein